jgi:hypothetical protein
MIFIVSYSFYLVPGGGLEPPRPCGLRILSPLRLPISPSGLGTGYQLNPKSKAAAPHAALDPRLTGASIEDAGSEYSRHPADIPQNRYRRRRSSSRAHRAAAG